MAPLFAPALSYVGGLDDPKRVDDLRRHGIAVAALPGDAARRTCRGCAKTAASSCSRLPTATTRGSWRDVLRVLGAG